MNHTKYEYKNVDVSLEEDDTSDYWLRIMKDGELITKFWMFANEDGLVVIEEERPNI